ncbi:MAG: AMP-binding protein, partial [Rhodoblastus sp.]|nr:AMP-binding protein [Rhodoblastus sp.]
IWVPTNFRLTPDEVVYLATFSRAKGFLCHGDFPEHAEAVRAGAPSVEFVWRLDEQSKTSAFGEADLTPKLEAFRGRAVADAAVEYNDPCWYFFTSGTTGRSKAAVLTHGQMA